MSYNVICVCLRIVVSNIYCVFVFFVFVLSTSQDCLFLIILSVFSNVHLKI